MTNNRLPAHLSLFSCARLRACCLLMLLVSLPGLASAQVLFSDSFNIPHAEDINGALATRQTGPASPSSYGVVTVFAADANQAGSQDRAVIENEALSLTDARMPGKGPAALLLGKTFSDAMGPFLLKATIRPGTTAWSGFKWTPQRNGNWPDLSYGISVTISPGGSWTVWANGNGKNKNVIGHGQVVRADEYPVAFVFSGTPSDRRIAVIIGDALVVPETPVNDNWSGHNLVFLALGGKTSGTAHIDNLSIEKLTSANNPVIAANKEAASSVGIWIEGEDVESTNFHSGKVINVDKAGPSGGMFLRLYVNPRDSKLPQPPYLARYKVNAPVGGTYNLWIASTPQNAGWASPLAWSINGSPQVSLKGKAWSGAPWGAPKDKWAGWVFGWTLAGSVELTSGTHELELSAVEPRDDGFYIVCLDAILLTNSKSFLPVGSRPRYSPQPSWEERMKTTTERDFAEALNRKLYYELIGATTEQVGEETSQMVLSKIAVRPFPRAEDRAPETTEFGLHGMEQPFVVVSKNAHTPEVARAYELLARAGVDSLRTAESTWHRMSPASKGTDKLSLDFTELDFQVNSAWKYGMTHLFTVGYPPKAMTVANHYLSACKPQFYPLYREYFETVFARYKDKGMRYVEMGNEVDAPSVWWKNSTPAQYVTEMRMMHEAARKVAPPARTVAFASTYARDEERGGPNGGRRFITASFDLGIDKYSDTYSLHHLAELKNKDYPAFFRRELQRAGTVGKPLLNTEQYGDGPYPYDGAKAFARVFFLYDMPRMDFFLARDFYENGYLKPWGLFDMDWRPKLRLLVYAFSVDAMRGRELVGMAQPAPGIEAYVLKRRDDYRGNPATPGTDSKYSIVLWKTDREVKSLSADALVEPTKVGTGLPKKINAAFDWKLDAVYFDKTFPAFSIGDEPVALYSDDLPSWKLLTRDEYLDMFESGKADAPLPTSNL